ncbi:MAG: molybdopterin-dependent oxidoreductase [Streptosporangiales bacterium]|nr:molybdopterin-dependent oxidoreductase [Streptosporangiales bacterium]
MPVEKRNGYCTLCRSRCGAVYEVAGDRLVGVEPAPWHPTGGALCPKGRAAPEIAHGPRRLRRPMRRTAPKSAADPGWVEVDWDTALAEIAGRLDRIGREDGPESVAFALTSPSGTSMSDSIDWVERFIRLYGSPNIAYATEICNWHKDFAHAFTFGQALATPDYAHTDLVLLWGHNPARVWLSQSTAIAEAKLRGARVAVVDPRNAGSGLGADRWLRVRPGTDAALALGVARELLAIGGQDDDFLRRWTNAAYLVRCDTGEFLRDPAGAFVVYDETLGAVGYDPRHPGSVRPDALRLRGTVEVSSDDGTVACRPAFDHYAAACEPWTPERVEQVTWVPRSEVRGLARDLAEAGSVAYYSWSGVGQHTGATQTDRAISLLYALTGAYDAVGGNRNYARPPVNPLTSFDQLAPEQQALALGLDERPLGPARHGWVTVNDLSLAILEHRPYPVRALLSFGTNLLLSHADPQQSRQALERVEFAVHADLYLNPSAQYADIVLPVTTPWEREAVRVGFDISAAAGELAQHRPRMIPPVGDARSDAEIVVGLAERLGMGGAFFDGDIEAGWNHMLAPLGIDVDDLRAAPQGISFPQPQRERGFAAVDEHGAVRGFDTETGRVEVYSALLARHGYPAVPEYVEPPDAPGDAFPLVLSSAKSGRYCHSQHRGVSSLRRKSPEPTVELSPVLAEARNVADGDWVRVSTRHGSARFQAVLDETLHPGVVMAEHGWWQEQPDLGLPGYDPLSRDGSNYNGLIAADHVDPVSGSEPLRSFACQLRLDVPPDEESRWDGQRAFTVVDIDDEAVDALSLTLRAADGGRLPAYRPGQYVTVSLPSDAGDLTLERNYSLSDAPHGDEYRVTIQRLAAGAFSGHVHDTLDVGDTVYLSAPTGRFTLPVDADLPVVLVAGGVGSTPFLSFLEALREAGKPTRVTLYYGVRNGARHLFARRLAELAAQVDGLEVVTYYSRPAADDVLGRDYDHHGRITAESIPAELLDQRARFYLCGPDAMVRDLRTGLRERGVPGFDIFTEAFSAAAPPAVAGSHQVRFAKSGKAVTWHAEDGYLLDAAQRVGLRLPSGCRVGQCESCAVPLRSGSVHHTATDDVDDGICLTCCATPTTDIVLDA